MGVSMDGDVGTGDLERDTAAIACFGHLMLLPQRGRERIPLHRRRALETDRVLVIDVRGLLTHHRHHHPGQVRIEERRILLPRRGPPRQLAQLDPTDRRMDIRHPVVVSPRPRFAYCFSIPWFRSSRTCRAISGVAQETIPPSPEVMFFVGYSENIPPCPKVPT